MNDESNSPLNAKLSAAIDDPTGFDAGFVSERVAENFANFGVSEAEHREIFAKFNEPYPGDEDDSIVLNPNTNMMEYRPEETGDIW